MNTFSKATVIKIFEYLLELKNLTTPIIRDIRDYADRIWWQVDFPEADGCFLSGTGPNPEAWFEVHKQSIPPAPLVPQPLAEWLIEKGTEPDKPPVIRKTLNKINSEELITFDSDSQRVSLWNRWLNEKWKPWAAEALPRVRVQRIYGDLFAIYQRLQREGENIELVWGHGFLMWHVNGLRIRRPVFTTRVELLFDVKKGIFSIVPGEMGTSLELDMLTGINLPNAAHLVKIEQNVQEMELDPRDKSSVAPFLLELAHTFDPKGEAHLDKCVSGSGLAAETYPVIYDAPVLFLRSNAGRLWQTDFKGIIEAIRKGLPIPETIISLVTDKLLEPDESSRMEWKTVGENLLFPLPANEEQKEIVRRLARNIGVAVQGPPGTGKSHTIVNLIAHLLAHGKRVLVTCQAERALRVLGDMIRDRLPQIAPLCVSVIGGDMRSRKELEESIYGISEHLAQIDLSNLERTIQQLRKELDDCRNEIVYLKRELRNAVETEHAKISIAGHEMKPIEIADWLAKNQLEHGWFPDQISPESKPPLSDTEIVQLHNLIGIVLKSERESVMQKRPPIEKLPTAEKLELFFKRLTRYEVDASRREELLRGWRLPADAPPGIHQAIELASRACDQLELLSNGWLRHVLNDVASGGERTEHWREFIKECRKRINSIHAAERALADFAIETPKKIDLQQTIERMMILRDEFAKGKGLGFIFRHFRGKHVLHILNEYKLNNAVPRSADDINVLMNFLKVQEAKRRLATKWNNSIRDVDGPSVNGPVIRVLQTLNGYFNSIEAILGWEATYLKPLTLFECLDGIQPPSVPEWSNLEWLKRFRDGLKAYSETSIEWRRRFSFQKLTQFIQAEISSPSAHSSWKRLLSALERRDIQAWANELAELQRLADLEPNVNNLNRLIERLKPVAPRWLSEIEVQAGCGKPLEPPPGWFSAWEWKRADSWLKQHLHRTRPEELHQSLDQAKVKESRLTEELVAQTTWLEQARRITPEQRGALHAWLTTVQRITKTGRSKYDERRRTEAKQLMQKCRPAVPVWIMPLDRVISNLLPIAEKFDVVIVDESSQCDLFALGVLFRGKRAVIVGDQKQVSPEGVGKDQTEVHKLIDRHLVDIPNVSTATWDLQVSLFDKAQELFAKTGANLMLREHFRCVPEIIQFSNDQFYGGRIEPLRIPSAKERLNSPIVAISVPNGRWKDDAKVVINEPEARVIVAKIKELCEDNRYERFTMGVISLQGMDQAYLIESMLCDTIGEEEMLRRKLICGDSKHFQGDERNVMFLSMVAASEPRPGALVNKFAEQRFNVAASRARDQLWLFHSIELRDLNPNCMRYRLLQYCLDPKRAQHEMDKTEEIFRRYGSSRFHRDVYKLIVARGYRAIPEFKAGTHPYRIDIVIEGLHSRLAVECDGDEWHGIDRWEADQERQMVLERVGWKFWRVRGSAFYWNPEKAIEPLWHILEDMEILPVVR